MNHQNYLFNQLSALFHTGIFHVHGTELIHYEENPEYNPLYKNESLRLSLMNRSDTQKAPLLFKDDFDVFYACVRQDEDYYLMGPVSTKVMSWIKKHRYYHFYGIEKDWEKDLSYHTFMEILQMTGVFTKLITGEEYSDQQIVTANYHAVAAETEKQEQQRFDIRSEDEDIYRHSYQEERRILDAVRSGNVENAVRLSKEMDINIGRLAENEVEHWRNLSIVSTTICTRAAIEGGAMPAVAYRLSGFYINQYTSCNDVIQILIYRNHAIEELTKLVQNHQNKKHTSNYAEQCKDYIYKHYRQKLYLQDMADMLGISSNYLSRIFKKETGVSLQDFINDVRVEKAANLLIYSNETLSAIAEYVNFPSQSYFGKIFKKKMMVTPKRYRELHKPAEFYKNSKKK